jgi:hypothetical protein
LNLTIEDIDLLVDAMKCWEERFANTEVLTSILATVVLNEGQREQFMAEKKKQQLQQEQKARADKDRSITVQAKLIALKDSLLWAWVPAFIMPVIGFLAVVWVGWDD